MERTGSGGRVPQGGVSGVKPVQGRVVRGSFAVRSAEKAQAGFTLYRTSFKVATQNTNEHHVIQELEILKRFSDFQVLAKQLETVHAQSKSRLKFPPLIKAKYFERFKESVIEERKKSVEEMLHFVSNSPHLVNSAPLQHFITGAKVMKEVPAGPGDDTTTLPPTQQLTNHSEPTTPPPPPLTPEGPPEEEEGLSVGCSLSAVSASLQENREDANVDGLAANSDPPVSLSYPPIPLSDPPFLKSGGSSRGSAEDLLGGSDAKIDSPGGEGVVPSPDTLSTESSDSQAGEGIVGGARNERRRSPEGEGVATAEEPAAMSWWAEAMAETDNVVEDIDEVVEKMGEKGGEKEERTREEGGGERGGGGGRKGGEGRPEEVRVEGGKGREETREQRREEGEERRIISPPQAGGRRGSRPSSRSSASLPRRPSPSAKEEAAYVVQAGRLISQALVYERNREFEEAFDLLKAGVDLLLNGVQTDRNKERREVVRQKTSEYLLYAENLQARNLSGSKSPQTSQAVKEDPTPSSVPSSQPHHLQDFQVKEILGKVMLVESRHTGQLYVFKVLHKSLKLLAAQPKGKSKATKNRSPRRCPHMVKLLHHYETPNHRIFLLLEYARRGRLLDLVQAKREQWTRLRESATNPHPSSALISSPDQSQKTSKEETNDRSGGVTEGVVTEEADGEGEGKAIDDDDLEMEKMLDELTSIVPPTSMPPDWSLSSGGQDKEEEEEDEEEEEGSLNMNTLRKRFEESVLNKPSENSAGGNSEDPPRKGKRSVSPTPLTLKEDSGEPEGGGRGRVKEEEDELETAINVLPPTPTTVKDAIGREGGGTRGPGAATDNMVALAVGTAGGKFSTPTQPVDASSRGGVSKSNEDLTDQGPFFSPASNRNSPDLKRVDDWGQRLEDNVRQWAAQIILALEQLHSHRIICRDLHPSNILVSDSGGAVLTYFGLWDFVEGKENTQLAKSCYVAPELQRLESPTEAADWWSLGVFLFELLTGQTVLSCHPGGLHSHIPLKIPTPLSSEAQSLLTQLLQVSPTERLGSGHAGVEEIKSHSFFSGVDWSNP